MAGAGFTQYAIGASRLGTPLDVWHWQPQAGPASSVGMVVLVGVFHGDEGLSGALLHRFIAEVPAMPGPLLPPFVVLPVLNPDGLARGTRVNAHGVDLNRNYPTQNWQGEGKQTPYYEGPAPASEPETRALIAWITRLEPIRTIITVHTPYRVVNYDGPAKALAEEMAAHNGYPVVESIGYATPGSFGTYYGIERHIPVITLELPEDDPAKTAQPATLTTVWEENQAALLAALRFGLAP